MNDYLRVIRLGFGKGEPGKQACWMTALQSHIGGQWTDECECVDPVINRLCIVINDLYRSDNDARTEDILNFGLFRVLGTAGTRKDSLRRMFQLVDVAVRRWVPTRLRLVGKNELATRYETLPEIVDTDSALFAQKFAFMSCDMRDSFVLCESGRDSAANATTYAAIGSLSYATNSALIIKDIVTNSFSSGDDSARRKFTQDEVFPVLAKLVEMGPHETKEEPEPVCGVPEFQRLCGYKEERK